MSKPKLAPRQNQARRKAPERHALKSDSRHWAWRATMLALALLSVRAHAQESNNPFDSSGDFGGTGFMQMPSARMAEDGQLSVAIGHVWPYQRYALTLQALPWLEASLRYTNILNRRYGAEDFSGDQAYKDRAFDFKVRLIQESAKLPEVSLGLRDIGGTGLFASEYLVANRRHYDWDFMLGLGWGYAGSRGQVPNPFGLVSDSFKERSIDSGQGGKTNTSSYFHGRRTSILAGVSYRTAIRGLTLKAELDGNNYQQEPLNNPRKSRSPINIGANYQVNPNWGFTLAVEHGTDLMFQMVVREKFKSSAGQAKFDSPAEPVKARPFAPSNAAMSHADASAPNRQNTTPQASTSALYAALGQAGFTVESIAISASGEDLVARVSQKTWRNVATAAGRAARIIANHAPAQVERITIINLEEGIETHRASLLRSDLEKADQGDVSAEEMWYRSGQAGVAAQVPRPQSMVQLATPAPYPAFNWNLSPGWRQQVGGPDNPYFFQLLARASAEWRITPAWNVNGSLSANIYNNFNGLKLGSDSQLPHVRSDIKEYLKQGKQGITNLQTDYSTRLFSGSSWYAKASAGLLEEMFAGAGGEVLYKPQGQRWALGANAYWVRQRGYKQQFDLLPYSTVTGHIDWHYRWPIYNIHTTLSAGQYLAKDRGITFEISREFASGVSFGGWMTKTNVSAEQFGEGSFDKGIFIRIPMDYFSLFSSRDRLNIAWRPLTRDGGQKLNIRQPLYDTLRSSDSDALAAQWPALLK